MPNPTSQNEKDRPRKTDESEAEINQEMERRLILGANAHGPPAKEDEPSSQGNTVASRAAAAQSGRK